MRHLIDPLDFTHQEICALLDLADRICADPAAYQEVAAHKNWPPCSTSLPPAPASPLRLQC